MALLCVLLPSAQAGIAFVGLQGLGVSNSQRANLERIVTRVLEDIGGPNLLTPQQVREMLTDPDLDSLAQCMGQTRCLVDFGGISGSHVVLTGSVARFGDASMVILKLVDVLSDSEKASSQQKVHGDNDAELFEALRRQVVKLIDPDHYAGQIMLSCPVTGAAVTINGKAAGVCPLAGPISGLFAGTHTVTVSMMGYRTFTAMAEVEIGETTSVQVELQPLGVQTLIAADPAGGPTILTSGGPGTGTLIGSISLASLGVVAATVAGIGLATGAGAGVDADAAYAELQSGWALAGTRQDPTTYLDATTNRDSGYMLALVGGGLAAALLAGAGVWLWAGWEPARIEPTLAPTGDGLISGIRVVLP